VLRRTAWWFVVGLALGLSATARGQQRDQRAYIQDVEVEPYFLGMARVRVFASLLRLNGDLIEGFKPEELVLAVNNKAMKYPPGLLKFAHVGEPIDVVLVVQITKSYAEAIDVLEQPIADLLSDLGKSLKGSRVAIVTYGAEATQVSSFVEPQRARRAYAKKVIAEDEPALPHLKEGVDKAKRLLRESKAPRKVMVVIGDGRSGDSGGLDRDAFGKQESKLPKELSDAGIVVDTIAYDPSGRRGSYMLNLGQLSRVTNGFPRLAIEAESLKGKVASLQNELKSQLVATYFVPKDEVAGKTVKLECRSAKLCGYEKGEEPLTTNAVKALLTCGGGKACDELAVCIAGECITQSNEAPGGHLGLWLAIVGLVLGAGGVGVVVLRKKKQEQAAPVAAAAPPPSVQMPVLPDYSNIPYLKDYKYQLPPGAVAQPAPAPAPAARPAAAPPAAARVASLLILSGPRTGQQWPLRHGFNIGKAANLDLVIDDGFASTHHAQIHLDGGGGVTLVDMGSTNGTFVNGVRISTVRLTHGAAIRIGQTEMRFLQG
jgi:hypothetical protein